MQSLYLDPYLLSCPHIAADSEPLRTFVENLLAWREIRNNRHASLYMSSETDSVLLETGTYPDWSGIQTVVTRLGIKDIQARDVYEIISGLLTKVPKIEEDIGLRAIVTSNVSCDPEDHLSERPPEFTGHYKQLLLVICVARHIRQDKDCDHLLVTCGLPSQVRVSRISGAAECEFSTDTAEGRVPKELKGDIPSVNSPAECYFAADPVRLWVDAQDEQGYRYAVVCYICQTTGQLPAGNGAAPVYEWTLGAQFIKSAKACDFLHDPAKAKMLLRTCSETILRQSMHDTHALRTGKGASEPQEMRGKDTAWRRDIDRQYHLHYWETSSGPELASVGVHGQFGIPR